MKNKMIKKVKKKMHKGKIKSNLLMEMAEDFMDLVTNARTYKKISKKK